MRVVLLKRSAQFSLIFAGLLLFTTLAFTGCSSADQSGKNAVEGQKRETITSFLLPTADKEITHEEGHVQLDASNTAEGYLMLGYDGTAGMLRVEITYPQGDVYRYNLIPDAEAMLSLPLSGGSGDYEIKVLEILDIENMLANLCCFWRINADISDEFKPFLYPNAYCHYTADSQVVKYGMELSDSASNDLDYVEKVYNYVTKTITYDNELAAHTPVDYMPDADRTMERKMGICFDYAALMAALLRSQGIPTRLEVGYSGQVYHAWISIYLEETGWINNIIAFDGHSWSLMDPTFAASNSADSVKEYIGDGSNYTVKYTY